MNDLVKKIQAFDKPRQLAVLSLLKEMGVKINENRNGCFINLSVLNSSKIFLLTTFVESME